MVKGSIEVCSKTKVGNFGWCYYVFADSYELKPLKDVETYIKEEGHLPEVPSAQIIAEEGIDVTESIKILLKKVEELTLYTIEQEKEIEALKKQLK